MVRVLVFHNFYRSSRPSGENAAVLRDVELLAAAGHDVVLARKDSDAALQGGPAGAVRAAASAVYSVGSRAEAAELIRGTRPQVAHLHNLNPLWSPSVADALRGAGVPRVQVLHNYRLSCIRADHVLDGAPCHRCTGRRVALPGLVHRCQGGAALSAVMTASRAVNTPRLLGADRFLAVSDTVRRRAVQHGVPADRIAVKPETIDPDEPVGAPGADAPYFAFAGRLDANKGVALLLEAFRGYRAAGGALRLRIAGSGPLEQQVAAAAHDGVHALGRLTPAEVRVLLAGARAVVAPAVWEEPFGLGVLEAWRERRPVVVTDLGGPGELVDDRTGWVVPPVAEELRLALHAADDPDAADARGATGRRALLAAYSGPASVAAYEAAWSATGALPGRGAA